MAKFEAWLKRVDAALEKRVGLSSRDLADCSYYDWFEDGISPSQAARLVLQGEGF
jgi:hypothetical protein